MFTTNYKQVDKKISVKTLCWFSKIIVQALIDYNSQHLPELRLLYHNFSRCKWTFSHNLNFLRKKPFIFIKNYTFYFGKYITTYYLLMCRILQFFNMLFFFLNEKIYRKSRCADCRKPFSNTLQEFWIHLFISFTTLWLIPLSTQQEILSLFRHSTELWQKILIELL